MTFKETMANLFSASEGAYYKWKRENRPIIQLVDKYLSKENIEEFLDTGKIQKLENISYIIEHFVDKNLSLYSKSFEVANSLLHKSPTRDEFKDFYFYFLINLKKINFSFDINLSGIHSLLTHFLYQYQMKKLKESLKKDIINQEIEEFKIDLNELINNSNAQEIRELEKNHLTDDKIQEQIIENMFSRNKSNLKGVMKYYDTFNLWNNDIYHFLMLMEKDNFDYFINSKNDELLYQAIGFLVYSSSSENFEVYEKLDLISSIFHYFIFNRDLISSKNVKEHIKKRFEEPESFFEIDKDISHKYKTTTSPKNDTDNLNLK